MNQVKKILAALLAAQFCFFLTGCQKTEETKTAEKSSQSIAFTDDTGQQITIQSPQRVAVLIGSFADMYSLASGKDEIVAAAHDTWTSFDLDLSEDVQDLGDVKSINTEVLLAAKPDLVIASAKNDSQLAMKDTLEASGIPAAYFDVSSFEDYLRVLEVFCLITGDEQAYQTYGASLQKDIDALIEKASQQDPADVLYIRATGKGVSVKNSQGSVLGEMLEDLNTHNIADSDTSLLENLSLEAIAKEDPDYIFLILQGSDDTKAKASFESEILSQPIWQNLTAVKEGRFYILDQNLYNLKPNAKWAQAYEQLYEILYGSHEE